MGHIVWNIDPELVRFGSLAIRYYGLLFVGVFYIGFYLFRWQMLRAGWTEDDVSDMIIPAMLGVVVGARLGHCLFYDFNYYFIRHPEEIIKFWKGGLASHGATIGLIVALWYYARSKRMSLLEVGDRFSFAIATGATLVRIGNFFNSEIVGRVTNVPWCIKFPRCVYDRHLPLDQVPCRHPSQIYEALMGATIFLVLWLADRKYKEDRPRGLLIALFTSLYFTGRFFVEFFKEYQSEFIHPGFPLTMGQILSIPLALFGYGLLYYSLKKKLPAASITPQELAAIKGQEEKKTAGKSSESAVQRRSSKQKNRQSKKRSGKKRK